MRLECSPESIILQEIRKWASLGEDAQAVRDEAKGKIMLVGDRRVMDHLTDDVYRKKDFSQAEIADTSAVLQAILEIAPSLDSPKTTPLEVGMVFTTVLRRGKTPGNSRHSSRLTVSNALKELR